MARPTDLRKTTEYRLVNPESYGDCLLWTGPVDGSGYGIGHIPTAETGARRSRTRRAHVVAFEKANGPLPRGSKVDHTCHNESECVGGDACIHRRCINLEHLRAVTHRTNVLAGKGLAAVNARKTHCVHGHELSGANLRVYVNKRNGQPIRFCLTCKWRASQKSSAKRYARKKAENPSFRRDESREYRARKKAQAQPAIAK